MKRLLTFLVALCVVFVLMPLTERTTSKKTEKPKETETSQKQETTEENMESVEETKSKLPERTVRFSTISTSLGSRIAINFYVELSDDLLEDPNAYMQFRLAEETLRIPLSEGVALQKDDATVYAFSCPVAAKNIVDKVTAQVYNDSGTVGDSKAMSVADYCNWSIGTSKDENMVGLMKTVLNYGAAAQRYFDYRTNKPANASLAEADKRLPSVDASAYAHSQTGSEDGIKPVRCTLILEAETTIRCYFQLTGRKTIDQYTFAVDGETVEPQFEEGLYYIEKTPRRLEEMYVFTCGGITIQYGALSYVNQIMNQYESGAAFDMACALYAYAKAAETYSD